MNAPRLFLIGGGLLLINAAAVLTTGIWQHVGADEPQVEVDGSKHPSQSLASSAPTTNLATHPVADQKPEPTSVPSASPLDRIPVPEALPEIPSLADPEAVKNDPGFQEFSRMFSKVEESWEADYPTSASPQPLTQSGAYFEALDGRLETVEQLCSAARHIAGEAGRFARSGRVKESQSLVQMATQLRDMAAQLLVSEL